jgi:acyl-CoA thioesterase FadM
MESLVGVVSRLELDYLKPVFWDPVATVTVRTGVRNIERFSIYLNQMVEDSGSRTCARARVQLAMYDSAKKVPVAIDLAKLRRDSV